MVHVRSSVFVFCLWLFLQSVCTAENDCSNSITFTVEEGGQISLFCTQSVNESIGVEWYIIADNDRQKSIGTCTFDHRHRPCNTWSPHYYRLVRHDQGRTELTIHNARQTSGRRPWVIKCSGYGKTPDDDDVIGVTRIKRCRVNVTLATTTTSAVTQYVPSSPFTTSNNTEDKGLPDTVIIVAVILGVFKLIFIIIGIIVIVKRRRNGRGNNPENRQNSRRLGAKSPRPGSPHLYSTADGAMQADDARGDARGVECPYVNDRDGHAQERPPRRPDSDLYDDATEYRVTRDDVTRDDVTPYMNVGAAAAGAETPYLNVGGAQNSEGDGQGFVYSALNNSDVGLTSLYCELRK